MKKPLMTRRLANTHKVFNEKLNFFLCNMVLKNLRIHFKTTLNLMTIFCLLHKTFSKRGT